LFICYDMNIPHQFVMYGRWDSINIELIPIDLLEGLIGMQPIEIEPMNLSITGWSYFKKTCHIKEERGNKHTRKVVCRVQEGANLNWSININFNANLAPLV